MKTISILFLVVLAGCSTAPKEDYQQAYEMDLVDGKVMLTTLRALDAGDVQKARRIGITDLHITLSALADYGVRAHPTAEQQQEAVTLARGVLDYMLAHREEIDPRLPSVRIGIRGLQQILTQPEDVRRLTELSHYLAGIEQRMSAAPKP